MKIIAKWLTVVTFYLVNPFSKGNCLDEEHVCECSLKNTDVMQYYLAPVMELCA